MEAIKSNASVQYVLNSTPVKVLTNPNIMPYVFGAMMGSGMKLIMPEADGNNSAIDGSKARNCYYDLANASLGESFLLVGCLGLGATLLAHILRNDPVGPPIVPALKQKQY